MSKAGYELNGEHFASLVRTCLLAGDVVSAVEALQQMQQLGLAFTHELTTPAGEVEAVVPNDFQEESLRRLMVTALSSSGNTAALDELYYALVDQAKSGGSVPRLALDAIVEAAGRLDLTDRAFATFNEYSSVFGLAHDIHSFNALLASSACARHVNMHTLLTILQQIDQTGQAADDESADASTDNREASAVKTSCTEGGEEAASSAVNSSEAASSSAVGSNSSSITGSKASVSSPKCVPNRRTFSLLLEAVVEAGELQVLDEVLRVMADSGVRPSSRAMRRVLVAFAKRGDWQRVDQTRGVLKLQEGGRELPIFAKTRLTAIAKQSESDAAKKKSQQQTNAE